MNAIRSSDLGRVTRTLLASMVLAAGIFAATAVPASAATTATFSAGVLTVFGDAPTTRS